MKIALLTYWGADNYGAILQSYATIKALEACGHEVELVNYIIPEPPRSLIKNLILYPKHLKFERFRRKHFHHITRKYNSLSDLQSDPPKADCYLVGSDQTWNPELSRDKAKGFFLDFGDDSIIRASYASSFGVSDWKDTKWICEEDVKRLLVKFHFVSVREQSGVELLNKRFDFSNVDQVADPVLLFSNYLELTGGIQQTDDIILYKFVGSDIFYMKCKDVGDLMHLPVRSIGTIRKTKGVSCSYPETIEGWIKRIAGAKYVITDSFHGTVLSILYKKQFVVWPGKRVTRLQSILNTLNLNDRFVSEENTPEEIMQRLQFSIDYAVVNEKLNEMRKHSFDYIRKLSNTNNV